MFHHILLQKKKNGGALLDNFDTARPIYFSSFAKQTQTVADCIFVRQLGIV